MAFGVYSPGGGGGGGLRPVTPVTADTDLVGNTVTPVDSSAGAVTLTLPNPAGSAGVQIVVLDSGGDSQTNFIKIERFGSERIQGFEADYYVPQAYGSVTLFCDGTNWFVVG